MDFPDPDHESDHGSNHGSDHDGMPQDEPRPRPRGQPVDCKICRDTVYPTYQEQEIWDRLRGKKPRRVYENEDGRLICPCKCSGSIKWVHESCLQEWRYSQAGQPSQWKCATCGYEFQFERMDWARRLRSPLLAFALAVVIVILTVFLLGFMGDRILDLWLDPAGTIYGAFGGETDDWDMDFDLHGDLGIPVPNVDEESWTFHFLKGLFSLGLVGFVKAFFAMSPFQWWNLRSTGIVGGGGRRRGTGRDRLEDVNLTLVVIGAVTFFWAVWKGTRRWTQHALDKTSERILNAQSADQDDDDDEDGYGDETEAAADDPPNAASSAQPAQPAMNAEPIKTDDPAVQPDLRHRF